MSKWNEIDCCLDCDITKCPERCVYEDGTICDENYDKNDCVPGGCKNFVRKRKLAMACWLNKDGDFEVEYWDGTKETVTKEEAKNNPIKVGYIE